MYTVTTKLKTFSKCMLKYNLNLKIIMILYSIICCEDNVCLFVSYARLNYTSPANINNNNMYIFDYLSR